MGEVATEYLCEKLKTSEDVVSAAVFMVATQLAREPLVRQTVREIFQERATVTVRPTSKGIKDIGEDHEIFTMKYLKDKPIKDFKDEEFLKLSNAADAKLIEMTVAEDIGGQTTSASFLAEAQDLYKIDAFAKSVTSWNKLRADAVEMAFKKMLYPQLRKELINKIKAEAIEGVKRSVQRTLYDWIKWHPYTKDFSAEDDEAWDTSDGVRVLGIGYSEDQEDAAYAVLIDTSGDMKDYLKLSYIMKRDNSYIQREREGKDNDRNCLMKLIKRRKPHVIAVSAVDMNARNLQIDINKIVEGLKEREEIPDDLEVVLMDNNLAKVYANSTRAEQDFREFPTVLREAISIARRLQDPLLEFSQLCGNEKEILCLRFHPMQEVVSEEQLLEAINLEFINRVNEVGVNINDCAMFNFKSNLVQFVGGKIKVYS